MKPIINIPILEVTQGIWKDSDRSYCDICGEFFDNDTTVGTNFLDVNYYLKTKSENYLIICEPCWNGNSLEKNKTDYPEVFKGFAPTMENIVGNLYQQRGIEVFPTKEQMQACWDAERTERLDNLIADNQQAVYALFDPRYVEDSQVLYVKQNHTHYVWGNEKFWKENE